MTFDAAEFGSVVANIGKRIPLPDFTAVLRHYGLPFSNSWAVTVARLVETAEDPKISSATVVSLNAVVEWLSEYLRFSSKALFVYEFPAAKLVQSLSADFRKNLRAIGIRKDHPHKFPALMGGIELPPFLNRVMRRRVIKSPNGLTFIFSSVQEYQIREDIKLSPADTTAVKQLGGYSKVIGLRSDLHEQIDIVRFTWSGSATNFKPSIEMILDVTKPGGGLLNQNEVLLRSKKYRSIINASLLKADPSFSMPPELNFFPVIHKLYDSKEGNVCELGFVTTLGGSVKTEKMKRNSADLRSELWHAGAMTAIKAAPTPDTIEIYKLNVSWKISMSSDEPVLSIPGTYRALSTVSIDHAIFLGCSGRASFNFAYRRLMNYAR